MKRLAVMFVACCGMSAFAPAAGEPTVHFARDVAPIFERECAQCHGDKQQLSDLDLSSREALLKGGKHGPAIVPGDAAKRRLYRHLTGLETPVMPFGKSLPKEQIEIVARWIDEGAEWREDAAAEEKTWWAFVPPERREPPGRRRLSDRRIPAGRLAAQRSRARAARRQAHLDPSRLSRPGRASASPRSG